MNKVTKEKVTKEKATKENVTKVSKEVRQWCRLQIIFIHQFFYFLSDKGLS